MTTQTLYLAGGCFWCTEAVFEQLDGVEDVTSGYAGGSAQTANYRSVCTGNTGHAEVIRITFDSDIISPQTLLDVFFQVAHDPTQLNRQGNDVGTQYRSALFYLDDQQKRLFETCLTQLQQSGLFAAPIVTTLEPLDAFYPAEDYHQGYAQANPAQPYIACVAQPKVGKLKQHFSRLIKS